LQEAWARFG